MLYEKPCCRCLFIVYLYINLSMHLVKKYLILALLSLLFRAVYAQTANALRLPPALTGIVLGKSSEADVIKALGKPKAIKEIKKDQCTQIEHPRTMFYEYDDQKIDIQFRRKDKKSAYIAEHIGFSIGTPVAFGDGILLGSSTRSQIIDQFGPGINAPGLCYNIQGNKAYCNFLTDEKGLLIRVLITKTKNYLE